MQFDAVVNHLNFSWTEQLSSLWNAVSYILTNNYLHSFNLLVDTFFRSTNAIYDLLSGYILNL